MKTVDAIVPPVPPAKTVAATMSITAWALYAGDAIACYPLDDVYRLKPPLAIFAKEKYATEFLAFIVRPKGVVLSIRPVLIVL